MDGKPDMAVWNRLDLKGGDLDVSALGREIWKRKKWIILPTLLAGVLAGFYVQTATPEFSSESRLIIENRESPYLRSEAERNLTSAETVTQEAIESQLQLITSRDVVRKVVDDLRLRDHPDFNPALTEDTAVSTFFKSIGLSGEPSAATQEERVLRNFYNRLSVNQLARSRVVSINFKSSDSDTAALVANSLADSYLSLQSTVKQENIRNASTVLGSEIEVMRHRVAEAEAKVEEYRSSANLFIGNNNNSLPTQQLTELNSQLVVARAQQAEAEARARLISDILKTGKAVEASDVSNSELMRRLVEQRVTLQAQLAEQSSTLLQGHPRIRELRAQIGALESQIRAEASKLSRTFQNDARMAAARVKSLTESLDEIKQQSTQSSDRDVQLRALEREAKAQRDLLETYLARFREAAARENIGTPPDARIVSRAIAAATPSFPRKGAIISIAMGGTFMLSLALTAVSALFTGGLYQAQGRERRRGFMPQNRSNVYSAAQRAREEQTAALTDTVSPAISERGAEQTSAPSASGGTSSPLPASRMELATRGREDMHPPVYRPMANEPDVSLAPKEVPQDNGSPRSSAEITALPSRPRIQLNIAPSFASHSVGGSAAALKLESDPRLESMTIPASDTAIDPTATYKAFNLPDEKLTTLEQLESYIATSSSAVQPILFIPVTACASQASLALDIGRKLVKSGERTILLQLSRQSNISQHTAKATGLSDLLRGTVSFGAIVHRDKETHLHILASQNEEDCAEKVLSHPRLEAVLEAMKRTYQQVLVWADVDPESSTAERLSRISETVVLVSDVQSKAESLLGSFKLRGFSDPKIYLYPSD